MKSVLGQSFGDYEVILVNDGSKDDSDRVIHDYQKADPRIKSMTILNSGPAIARNFGLAQAVGEYVLFLDSDDSFCLNALSLIAQKLIEKSPDLLVFGYYITDPDGMIISKNGYPDKEFHQLSDINSDLSTLYQSNQLNQVWNKAFRNSLIKQKNIQFSDHRYGEDRLFVLDVIRESNHILIMEQQLYLYVNNPYGSLITKYLPDKFEICRLINLRIHDLAESIHANSSHDQAQFDYMFFKNVVSSMVQLYDYSCDMNNREKKTFIKQILHDKMVMDIGQLSQFGLSTRVLRWIVKTRAISLNLLSSWIIHNISLRFPSLFIKTKHRYTEG